jgi:hypothetical protein
MAFSQPMGIAAANAALVSEATATIIENDTMVIRVRGSSFLRCWHDR